MTRYRDVEKDGQNQMTDFNRKPIQGYSRRLPKSSLERNSVDGKLCPDVELDVALQKERGC